MALGVAAAGYGIGAIVTILPAGALIDAYGYRVALLVFGPGMAIVGAVCFTWIRDRRLPEPKRPDPAVPWERQSDWRQMLATPVFYVLFLVMTIVSAGGLMIVSQLAPFARDSGVAGALVFGLPAIPLALTLDRATNAATRPFFGWISDRIGRENTMALAFTLEAGAIFLLLAVRQDPTSFVLVSGLVFFGWGEIFSLFPALIADVFGSRHAGANFGCLVVAQGLGSIVGAPLASLLRERTGDWHVVFACVSALDVVAAVLAVAVVRPLCRRCAASRGGPGSPLNDAATA